MNRDDFSQSDDFSRSTATANKRKGEVSVCKLNHRRSELTSWCDLEHTRFKVIIKMIKIVAFGLGEKTAGETGSGRPGNKHCG
jgi:hypothetical protein